MSLPEVLGLYLNVPRETLCKQRADFEPFFLHGSETSEIIEDQIEAPERRNEPLLVFSMDGNERQPDPDGEDHKASQRISFNASLDEQCERDRDNDRTANRNTNPVHAPLELEEIGKPGVLTLHFAEDIRDRGAGHFRGAVQFSYPAYECHSQRDVERSTGETKDHDSHVAPMADERVRDERVENDLIHN